MYSLEKGWKMGREIEKKYASHEIQQKRYLNTAENTHQ